MKLMKRTQIFQKCISLYLLFKLKSFVNKIDKFQIIYPTIIINIWLKYYIPMNEHQLTVINIKIICLQKNIVNNRIFNYKKQTFNLVHEGLLKIYII